MNKLKEIRLSKNITQFELSVFSGVSLQNIKYLEKDGFDLKQCKYETLDKLASVLKIKVDKLLK